MTYPRSDLIAPGPRPGATRLTRGHRLAAALLSAAAVHLVATGAASAGAIVNNPGCAANTLPRSDDGASAPVPIGFNVNLSGNLFSQLYVDTNGYVTFGAPPPTFFDFSSLRLDTTNLLVIAPFLSDVDTRNPASDVITYGSTTFGTQPAFCVTWGGNSGVGYYDTKASPLNRFQLLLVDQGLGNFDVVLNYDQVLWDQPDDCLNGVCASMAGFFPGASSGRTVLPGSGTPGALLDGGVDSLIAGTNGGTLGRYTFSVTNGVAPSNASIAGTIYDPNGLPIAGAPVQACAPSAPASPCVMTVTNGLGNYMLTGFPQAVLNNNPFVDYDITVGAPPGTGWLPPATSPFTVTVSAGDTILGIDFTLAGPQGIAAGTTLSPSAAGAASVPTVFWGNPLTLATHGCPGGTASYTVQQNQGIVTTTLRSGSLTESPAGSGDFNAALAPFSPNHGYATISIVFGGAGCSAPPISFDIYIDPSGNVHNTHGAPIEGAIATLLRSDSPFGPFDPVPDGSAIMSPSNRANPSFTDATGFFGWDVIAGYYIVRAEKPGCTSPLDPARTYVETEAMRVPTEITGLDLILDCDAVPPPVIETPGDLRAEATSSAGAVVTYAAAAIDSADGPVAVFCAPPSGSTFPLGTTAVLCSAQNSAGNSATAAFSVTVVDTTPPVLTLPVDITAPAASGAGSLVSYVASASDLVSGAIVPACSPVSGSLFPVGTTSVTCLAADPEGNAASGAFRVSVVYDTLAVLPPLSPDGSASFKKGQAIPVKFTLGGVSAGIADATARLFVAPVVARAP